MIVTSGNTVIAKFCFIYLQERGVRQNRVAPRLDLLRGARTTFCRLIPKSKNNALFK